MRPTIAIIARFWYGAIAIIGGVNLSTDYESNPLARSNPRTGPATQADGVATTWRDTDMQIEGPAVAEVQALFLDHWTQQHGSLLHEFVSRGWENEL
jgi:cardiolipin synthase